MKMTDPSDYFIFCPSRADRRQSQTAAFAPHDGQNFDFTGKSIPHEAHFLFSSTGLPHSGQNRELAGTRVEHLVQAETRFAWMRSS